MRKVFKFTLMAFVSATAVVSAGKAQAQESQAEADVEEADAIVVTARKRDEALIDVPVSMVAFGKTELERYSTQDLVALSTQVPGLILHTMTSAAGGVVALRGVTSSSTNPSSDQGVSFNVDGVQAGSANIMRFAQIDLQQIEVLKGPQALFFGKNSPGGIISIRSADPGDALEVSAVVSHEFNARETSGHVVLSTPLSDTLGIRLVGYGMTMSGWVRNAAPDPVSGISFPGGFTRASAQSQAFFRGTLLYRPDPSFSARFKYNYGYLDGDEPNSTAKRISCPNGAPQVYGLPFNFACNTDPVTYRGGQNPTLMSKSTRFPFLGIKGTQQLASLELNYEVAPGITVTSVSGYYKLNEDYYADVTFQPASLALGGSEVDRRELSQELRITTSRSEWPVNFTVGAYYQDMDFAQSAPLIVDAFVFSRTLPLGNAQVNTYNQFFVPGKAYSFFGQAIWNITDEFELAGGARWSHESRSFRSIQTGVPVIPTVNKVSFNDTSPEVTLRWHPTKQLSVFGAFRNGFKSGGFNTGAGLSPLIDPSYRPEDAKGFELGVKAELGRFQFNLTGYTYKYTDMQVSTFDPVRVAQVVVNAAGARIQGIDADFSWRPQHVSGLEIRGSVSYNHARYTDFFVGCYTGQTIANGCNTRFANGQYLTDPGPAAYNLQNFKGRRLLLAPDWTGNLGFSYTRPISDGLQLSVSADGNYSSSYFAQLEQIPGGVNRERVFVDANIRLSSNDDSWALTLIGRNLTGVSRSNFTSQVAFTGIGSRTGTNLTGGEADVTGFVSRGRQIRLQLSARFR